MSICFIKVFYVLNARQEMVVMYHDIVHSIIYDIKDGKVQRMRYMKGI